MNFKFKIQQILEFFRKQKAKFFCKFYFYFKQKGNLIKNSSDKFVRVRDNGEVTTITYKDKTVRTISGTKELELEISDFDKANQLLNLIGFNNGHYVENKRRNYFKCE